MKEELLNLVKEKRKAEEGKGREGKRKQGKGREKGSF
jgi:hypothetical protein